MANEGIAAALTIPVEMMEQLEKAQRIVTQMAESADKMGKGFQTAAASMGSIATAFGGKNISAAFDTSRGVSQIEVLSDATVKLNKSQSAAAEGARELNRALNMSEGKSISSISAKISAIEKAMRAPGLTADKIQKATAKLQELKGTLSGMTGDAQSSFNAIKNGLSKVSNSGNIETLRARLAELKESLRQLKALEKQGFTGIPVGAAKAVEGEIKALNQRIAATNSLMGVTAKNANMVRGMLSMAFSPIMIASFLRNLVNVRGEFELAQKSLAVLIRNEGVAADMFEEISKIAIKSPFSVMEMTKQTKQLAAYRIENEKLIETTKMLGDISAGVGVDMNRLILAYGQVKAATFLKGQELRQFSEAGVNMLGGLAERFSDLYQRAVSTGEVLQMVSKRMVKFEDVDAVLRKQTSEGGAFFQMQEKQAEILKGMIVNLQDRIQLMFNKVGTEYDSLMKGIVKGIEWVISNARLLSSILIPLVTMKVTSGVIGLITNGTLGKAFTLINSITAHTASQIANIGILGGRSFSKMQTAAINFKRVIGSVSWAGWVSAALAIAAALYTWYRNATAFRREVEGVFEKAKKSSDESIRNYNQLVDKATDTTQAEQDRVAAIEELKKQYGNILPIQDLELSNVERLNDAREQQIELIKEQIRMEARADAMRAATKEAEESSAKRTRKLYQDLMTMGTASAGFNPQSGGRLDEGGLGFIQRYESQVHGLSEITKKEIDSIRSEIDQKIISGTITDANKARDEFLAGVLKRSGATADQISAIIDGLGDSDFSHIAKQFDAVIDKIKFVNDSMDGSGIDTSISRYADKYKDAIKGLANARADYIKSLTEQKKAEYASNPAQMELDVADYIRNQKAQILAAIRNEDYGPIGDEMKKQLETELERAFAKDGSVSPIDNWFMEQVAAVNDKFPELVRKMNTGELQKKQEESIGDYNKRLKKASKEVEQTLKTLYESKGNDGRVQEIASQWGGDAWNSFVRSRDAAKDLKVELDGLPSKISEAWKTGDMEKYLSLTQRQREAQNEYNDALQASAAAQAGLYDATESNLKAELAGMQMLIDYLGAVNDAKAAAAAASQYKSNLKSFVNEVKGAAQEFDKLNNAGKDLLQKKLEASARKLNISIPEEFNEQSFEAWFDKLESKLPKEEVIEMRLAWNKDATADAIKKMSDEASALWDKYDNAKKLEGWGLNFVGQSSASILKDIEAIEKQLRDEGTKESIAQANQIKEKRLQILRTEQDEAAKIMYEAQKKALTKTEQAYQTMFENINKIRQDANKGENKFSQGEIDAKVQAQIAKSMKEVADAEWDAYKSTELYAAAFGDLDNMSKGVLETLRDQLEGFREQGGLAPTEIQAIEKAIAKLNLKIKSVNSAGGLFGPMKAMFDAVKDYRNAFGAEGAVTTALNQYNYDSANLDYWEEEANRLRQMVENGDDSVETLIKLSTAEDMVTDARKQASASMRAYRAALEAGNQGLADAIEKLGEARDTYSKVSNTFASIIGLVEEMSNAFGVELGDEAQAAFSGLKSGITVVGTAISVVSGAMEVWAFVTKKVEGTTKSLLETYWPLLAVGAALGAIVAIIQAKDKKLEKQIEDSKYAVERLKVAYDELEQSMKSAMDLRESARSHDQMIRNLNEQIEKLKEAKAAEEERKSRNGKREKAVTELEDQINETTKAIDEAKNEWLEFMGAFSDSRNEAKDWASSWLDAFKSAENGVKSLSDSFDEMYEDIVTAQLTDVLTPQIEQLKQLIASAVEDGYLDSAEVAAIQAQKDILQSMDASLRDRARELGIGVSGESNANTLQKGLEAMTEQTAQALESILNSTRYYVADNNRILLTWDELIMNPENENSILSNIRTQTRYLRTLSTIAQAVYSPGSTGQGAGGLKVFVMG